MSGSKAIVASTLYVANLFFCFNSVTAESPPLDQHYTHLVFDGLEKHESGPIPVRMVQQLPSVGREATKPIRADAAGELLKDFLFPNSTFRSAERIRFDGEGLALLSGASGRELPLLKFPKRAHGFSNLVHRLAISPNHKLFVTTRFIEKHYEPLALPEFQLLVFNLQENVFQPKTIRESIFGESQLGGGLWPNAISPALIWKDDMSVLLAEPSMERKHESVAELADEGRLLTHHKLLAVDVASGNETSKCELQLESATHAAFWRRCDGAIMLRQRGSSLRIDLETGATKEDRCLSPQYELKGDKIRPSLWYNDQCLAEEIYYKDVGVSPDGRHIAWYDIQASSHIALGNTAQFRTKLWYHSKQTGTVELTEGNFASASRSEDLMLHPRFLWVERRTP